MLDSTLDLISQAVSNDLYVFCLFNLIIVMILMGSKHGSSFDQDYEIPLSTPTYHKQDAEAKQSPDISERAMNPCRVPGANETATEGNKGTKNDSNGNSIIVTDEDDEGDDELRRRVEEFIAKVNREWRAEKLSMSISA
ncbi:uncharacterized protein LOC110418279 [Herrania umbratica]|uniref:Uncharacterized protein LOC110418279 n=1 Tax=Herrania umbratica TaxID=108875 RepID=A0A6J1AII7_9ROSI|nr:uncharacterized protein LOC110418279 [Herrania umbratica]